MKVFLRLVEDVIIFQNLQNVRRREIVNALSINMGEIMELFINLLQEHTNITEALVRYKLCTEYTWGRKTVLCVKNKTQEKNLHISKL